MYPDPDTSGYRIWRGTSPGNYTAYYEVPADWSGVLLGGLSIGTRYYFVVTSINNNNVNGSHSGELSFIAEQGPAPPTSFSGFVGLRSGEVTLSWVLSTDADTVGYRIWRGTSPGSYDVYYDNIPADWEGAIIGNLATGTAYYFEVTAINSSGVNGYHSNELVLVPQQGPSPPTGVTGYPGPEITEVTLRWNYSTDPNTTGYRIWRGASPGNYNVYYNTVPPEYSGAYLGSLSPGTTYYFVVTSVNSSEVNGANSNEVAVDPGSPPEPPTGMSASEGPGSGTVTVSWVLSGSPYIDYYKLYQGTSPGNYSTTYNNIPAEWNTGMPVSGLTDGVTYYFAMTAVNTGGVESGYSNETFAMPVAVGDSEPPADPANLTISDPGTGAELDLSWNVSSDNAGVSHYLIYRLTNNSSVSEYNYDSGFPVYTSATGYIDYGLSETNTYYYRVLAVDTSDNRSGLSNLAWDSPDDKHSTFCSNKCRHCCRRCSSRSMVECAGYKY